MGVPIGWNFRPRLVLEVWWSLFPAVQFVLTRHEAIDLISKLLAPYLDVGEPLAIVDEENRKVYFLMGCRPIIAGVPEIESKYG
jgi:hypothetical protein